MSAHINDVGIAVKVRVTLLPAKKKAVVVVLPKGATAEAAIRKMNLFPDAWIPVRENTPIPLDAELVDGEEMKLIAVVSGG
ncbi:MAG TPA: hypothetical protein VGB78_00500 [Thermoplasmata archaeon]